jgi:nucleotide-binding universal stress UspA family protein
VQAANMHADLIVIGNRGLGKLKRIFLGSVSDYILRHASVPVIVVHPSKDAPQNEEGTPSDRD